VQFRGLRGFQGLRPVSVQWGNSIQATGMGNILPDGWVHMPTVLGYQKGSQMIIGLDISTKTGVALYEPPNIKTIRTCTIVSNGETHEQKAEALADGLIRLFKSEGRPEFVAIEQPLRNVMQHRKQGTRMMPDLEGGMTVNAGTALMLNQLVGSTIGILRGYGIPWVVIPVQSWRKGFFPKGTKGADRADWKRLAKRQCELLGVDIRNNDEAEAVGVAVSGHAHYRNMKSLEAAQ